MPLKSGEVRFSSAGNNPPTRFRSCPDSRHPQIILSPSFSGDGMTKHNFVKLVWNANNFFWQAFADYRLLSAMYFPIDRRLTWWCLDKAPYHSLFSSFGGASWN